MTTDGEEREKEIERKAWIEALKWCFFVSECQVTQEHIEDKLRELEEEEESDGR